MVVPTIRERYRLAQYREIGRDGGDTVKRAYGREYSQQIGKKGGQSRRAGVMNVTANGSDCRALPRPYRLLRSGGEGDVSNDTVRASGLSPAPRSWRIATIRSPYG